MSRFIRIFLLVVLSLCSPAVATVGPQDQAVTRIYQNSRHSFPDNLTSLHATGHMAGGSGGVTILQDGNGNKYTLKCATQLD